MVKRFIIAFILLVLVVGGIVGFNLFREKAIQDFFASMPPPSATVSTTVVKPGSWTPGVEAIGTMSANSGVDLTVETAGIVKEIRFQANQKVKAGDVLLQLDDAVERADLEAAKAQAALDQTSLTRAQSLVKSKVGSEVALDQARATASASASQVKKLQAVLDQKQLKAPFSGTVGISKIDLGQYLAPGTAVVTLQDLETLRVDFSVPEQQLTLLKIGQTVKLGFGGAGLDATSDMPFSGTVRGINPKIDPVTRLVGVRAEIGNTQGKLTPGQFVQVRVELPEEQNVLAVPQTAVTTSLYGDYVFVVQPAPAKAEQPKADAAATATPEKPATEAEKPAAEATPPAAEQKPALVLSQVFVKLGRRNAGQVEIVSGISAGDQVVTAGQNRLFNGMSVNVDNTIDPTKPDNRQAAAQ
jgi:membrane fusion protein (multidrug efflux system)